MHFFLDAATGAIKAIDTVDPTRYFVKYGENTWAAVKGYLDEVTAVAAAPVNDFTESTTFWVMESIRLDLVYGPQVNP
jgi:hypothetical protein